MNISRDDAAKALSDIARTQARSRELFSYRRAGPILMVWAIIWIICFTAMGFLPASLWGAVWIPGNIVGIIASISMGYRRPCPPDEVAINGWRALGFAALIAVFSGGVFAVFHPVAANAYMAFPGLLTGAIYVAIGLASMPRFVWVGTAVMGLTLIGYFVVPQYLAFWMAATGGGGLLISGLLLRRT